ncbi:MAG: sigma-70 family RNA polymerase sigma factor [Patescibacteria group bacterium]
MSEHKSLKSDEPKIEELVLRAQGGDTDAFGEVYEIFFTSLYRYVYYRTAHHDSEDLLEIIFLKIWSNLHRYKKSEKSSFIAWAFRIAHNTVVDYYREPVATLELEYGVADERREARSEDAVSRKLNNEILSKALHQLKESYQQVLVLKFINELENDEISKILDKSENSLRILQFRALRALRKVLEGMGITEF